MLQRSALGAAGVSRVVAVLASGLVACGGSSAASPAASEPRPGSASGEAPAGSEAPAAGEAPAGSAAPAAAAPEVNSAVSAATSAAESWLQLIDQQQYDRSYASAASVFRGAVTQDAWSQAVGGVRGPLGKPLSRRLASASYATSLPSAPDGKYVVLQYETSFENKASAVETVTPMQDTDGVWRVAGYYVK